MKKVLMLIAVIFFTGMAAQAQTDVKVKKTATPGQKIHNTFSKHKRYKGYKVKGKVNGHKVKGHVNAQTGEAEIKQN